MVTHLWWEEQLYCYSVKNLIRVRRLSKNDNQKIMLLRFCLRMEEQYK